MPKLFIAISGSARSESTNTALLKALAGVDSTRYKIRLYNGHFDFPIFNPDNEGGNTPQQVEEFCTLIAKSDGLIISSPEYVRAIPGGLKNALDWLVSREELIAKPVVLAHASHRGDDMLSSLSMVLSTVTTRFDNEHFLRFSLMKQSSEQIASLLASKNKQQELKKFLDDFYEFVCRNN